MKLLTLNAHSWIEKDPEIKLAQLLDILAHESFDIIALQEVNQSKEEAIIHDPLYVPTEQHPIKADNFAAILVQQLAKRGIYYNWTWAFSHYGYKTYEEGCALLSLSPIEKSESLWLSQDYTDYNDYHSRKIVGIQTTIQQQDYMFYSIRASWWKDQQQQALFDKELSTLNQLQHTHTHIPIFLMGDFNNPAQIRHEGYDALNRYWYDLYTSAQQTIGEYTVLDAIDGWHNNKQGLRMDFILSSQQIIAKQCAVRFDGTQEPIISDHCGVSCTI